MRSDEEKRKKIIFSEQKSFFVSHFSLHFSTTVCFGFDLTRDDASQRLADAQISPGTAATANAAQCAALLDAAVTAAIECVRTELAGVSTLSESAQSAAIDVATALGCSKFKAIDKLVASLKAGDTAGAAAALVADDFCLVDPCRCAQNRYCLDPCVETVFDATCQIAPGSAKCETVVAETPFECKYSTWQRKSSCSSTCRNGKSSAGVEQYTRTVNDASKCTLALTESRDCKVECAAVVNNNGGGGGYAGGGGAPANANVVPNANDDAVVGGAAALDNNTIGAIVGGTLGGLALVGLLVFFARRRSSNNSKDRGDVYNPSHQAPAVANPLFTDANKPQDNPLFSEDSLQKIAVAPVPAPLAAAAPAPSRHTDDDDAPLKRKKSSKKKIRTAAPAPADDDSAGDAADTWTTQPIKRRESVLDDKPALAISSQGSVANLMDNSDL
jgi:GH24 family phage-related lysozyme (muramidase)